MPTCPLCNHRMARALTEDEIRSARQRLARLLRGNDGAGGRPRSEDRCPCEKYTRKTAEKRGHRCQ